MRKTEIEILEAEIKTSKADFIKDFKKTKYCKWYINSLMEKNALSNKMYYCFPRSLWPKIETIFKESCRQFNKSFGVMLYEENDKISIDYRIRVEKIAGKLHKNENTKLIHKINMRLCSENIGLRKELLNETD